MLPDSSPNARGRKPPAVRALDGQVAHSPLHTLGYRIAN